MTLVKAYTALRQTLIHGFPEMTGTNHHTQTTGTNRQAEETSSMTQIHLVNDVDRAHQSFGTLKPSNEMATFDLRCQMRRCQAVHLHPLPVERRTMAHLVLIGIGLCLVQRSRLGTSFVYERLVEVVVPYTTG